MVVWVEPSAAETTTRGSMSTLPGPKPDGVSGTCFRHRAVSHARLLCFSRGGVSMFTPVPTAALQEDA